MLRSYAQSRSIALVNFILRWDKAHTKSAALYTGATETGTTLLAAPIPGTAHIGNPMQLKNPILGLCQQATFMLSAAKVEHKGSLLAQTENGVLELHGISDVSGVRKGRGERVVSGP